MNSFQCPYDDLGCVYLDTAGMFKYKECYDCEHYKKNEQPEEEKTKEQEKQEMEDWNNFMMGL